MVGKWLAGQTPYQRGFDRYYGLTDGCCNFWNPGRADDSPAVRVTAAKALAIFGDSEDLAPARDLLVDHGNLTRHHTFTAMLALNALQSLGPEKTTAAKDRIATLPEKVDSMPPRAEHYVARLLQKLHEDVGVK